jgi:hypothetical protein
LAKTGVSKDSRKLNRSLPCFKTPAVAL